MNGIGIINGALIADGGTIDPGFSPGTIIANEFSLNLGSTLVLEIGVNMDGSVDTELSDGIIATTGGIDLQGDIELIFTALFDEALVSLNEELVRLVDVGSIFTLTTGQSFNLDPYSVSFMAMGENGISMLDLGVADLIANPTKVSEPGTMALIFVGLLGVLARRRSLIQRR